MSKELPRPMRTKNSDTTVESTETDSDAGFNFDQSLEDPTDRDMLSDLKDILENRRKQIEPAIPFRQGDVVRFDLTDVPYRLDVDIATGVVRLVVVTPNIETVVYSTA